MSFLLWRLLPFKFRHPLTKFWFKSNIQSLIIELGSLLFYGGAIIFALLWFITKESIGTKCLGSFTMLFIVAVLMVLHATSPILCPIIRFRRDAKCLAELLESDLGILKDESIEKIASCAENLLVAFARKVLDIEEKHPEVPVYIDKDKPLKELEELEEVRAEIKKTYDFFVKEMGIPIREGYRLYFDLAKKL
ncbi:MAG: hypothetical protein V1684_01415 [bacterium]